MKCLQSGAGSYVLSLVLLLGSQVSFSQKRSVDLEVICISPADTVVNGIGAPLRFEMRNHGPDLKYRRDTTLYWLYVMEGDQVHWSYSGATIGTSDGVVEIGQSAVYNDNYAIRFPFPNRKDTFTVDFCVIIGSSFINRESGDTVHPFSYIDPDNSNNMCCTPVTIVPQSSVTSIPAYGPDGGWSVYPNPVRDQLHISRSPNHPSGPVQLSITDVSGRIVLREHWEPAVSGAGGHSLDVSALPAGMYQVRIQSPEGIIMHKVLVAR